MWDLFTKKRDNYLWGRPCTNNVCWLLSILTKVWSNICISRPATKASERQSNRGFIYMEWARLGQKGFRAYTIEGFNWLFRGKLNVEGKIRKARLLKICHRNICSEMSNEFYNINCAEIFTKVPYYRYSPQSIWGIFTEIWLELGQRNSETQYINQNFTNYEVITKVLIDATRVLE